MKNQLFTGVALVALAIPGVAFAQSSGTIDAETIVVTGSRSQGIQGVVQPNTPKAQTVLTNEYLTTQAPGQSIINAINVVPSVNFTDNDAYGSSGGNVRIRGFDGNRVSLTWDGMPLNDSGNYAIFSNQTLDEEIIDQVNVNQGTTDVDSPTAASSGGTINYRTIVPSDEIGAILNGTIGENARMRVFGMLQSGEFTSFGTKMFGSVSYATNNKFKGPGRLEKQQYNIRVYQPLSGTDFISIAGHFNRNRNAFYKNLTLDQAKADFQDNGKFNYEQNARCLRPTPNAATPDNEAGFPQTGVTSIPGPVDQSCTNFYGVRINPGDTGNIRINSKFTLSDKLVLTVDPSFQYVLANGGGFSTLAENSALARGNKFAADPTAGVDFNRDGTIGNFGSVVGGVFVPAAPNATRTNFVPDQSAFYTPNTTNTYRYGVLASLRYDIADGQYVRLAYALDYARHRQTGEWTYLDASGFPLNVFGGINNPGIRVYNADGYALRQRDRRSLAELNQISAEYRGKFFEDKLEVMLGGRLPFFHRELNQYCYTQVTSGNPTCTSQTLGTTAAAGTTYIVPNNYVAPTSGIVGTPVYAPFAATYNYRRFLPNVGFTYRANDQISAYASFAQGFSSPRTDNLYRAPFVGVRPETTNNFDVGLRYSSSMFQGSLGGFYNSFKNRIVTSFDQDQGISVDRNVGRVEIKGLEVTANVRPFKWFSFNGFGSYIDAKLKDNIRLGTSVVGVNGATVAGQPIVALTAGRKLVETPTWQYGYRAQVRFGALSIGGNYKHVSSRFATDINDVKVPAYDTFSADARFSLKQFGLAKSFIQLNVVNLFDQQYLGSISSQIATTSNALGRVTGGVTSVPGGANPTFAITAPRTVSLTVQMGF
ncbi:TonB-dependent receptor [Sphingomonas antarctica]|uniref:TonB-dependent receptor n=1 Tax=Sphingomonas antarctica TaxID=2040274 RepID=UPI0039E990B7